MAEYATVEEYRVAMLLNLHLAIEKRSVKEGFEYSHPGRAAVRELAKESMEIAPERDRFAQWKALAADGMTTFPTVQDLKDAYDPEKKKERLAEILAKVRAGTAYGEQTPATQDRIEKNKTERVTG